MKKDSLTKSKQTKRRLNKATFEKVDFFKMTFKVMIKRREKISRLITIHDFIKKGFVSKKAGGKTATIPYVIENADMNLKILFLKR